MGDGAKIDLEALFDYSWQLSEVRDNALGTVDNYVRDHLEVSDQIKVAVRILLPATNIPSMFDLPDLFALQKHVSKIIVSDVGRITGDVADDLMDIHNNYAKHHKAAVEKLWNAGELDMPSSYHEEPHRKGNVKWDGADLKLKDIPLHPKSPDAIGMIEGDVGDVTGLIKDLCGIDLLGWVNDIIPDWAEFERLGKEHGELQKAYQTIHDELSDGMDYLGARWDGKAATAFEYYLRERYLVGLKTITKLHRTSKYGFTELAELFDVAVWVFVGMLTRWVESFWKACKDVWKVITSGKGLDTLWKLVKTLTGTLDNFVKILARLIKTVVDFVMTIVSAIDYFGDMSGGTIGAMDRHAS